MLRFITAAALVCLGITGTTASAGPARLCYVRVYGPAHLAQHPGQRVAELLAVVAAGKRPDGYLVFQLGMSVRLRDRPGLFRSERLDCGFYDPDGLETNMPDASSLADTATSIGCGAPGGGEVTIGRSQRGEGMLKLDKVKHLVVTGACKNASCRYDLVASPDDDAFRLERLSDTACAATSP